MCKAEKLYRLLNFVHFLDLLLKIMLLSRLFSSQSWDSYGISRWGYLPKVSASRYGRITVATPPRSAWAAISPGVVLCRRSAS